MSKFQEFRARLESKGFLRPNFITVRFFPPSTLGDLGRQLSFYCMKASLPDVGLQRQTIRRYGYGPAEKYPHRPAFSDLSLTYILDGKGKDLKLFQKWIASTCTFSHYDSISDNDMTTTGGNSAGPYEIAYRDEYVTDFDILVHDVNGRPAIKYHLRDVYPAEIRQIDTSWDETDQFMMATILFSYTDFRMSGTSISDDGSDSEEE